MSTPLILSQDMLAASEEWVSEGDALFNFKVIERVHLTDHSLGIEDVLPFHGLRLRLLLGHRVYLIVIINTIFNWIRANYTKTCFLTIK